MAIKKITRPRSGVCRVCGCTDQHACDGGCSWADASHTLCTNCVGLHAFTNAELGTMIDALKYAIDMTAVEMEGELLLGPRRKWLVSQREAETAWKATLQRYRALRRKLLAWERDS